MRPRASEPMPDQWGGRARSGPAEHPYSALKPVIRATSDWDVGDDDAAWTLAEQGQLQLAVQLCEAIESDGVASGLLTTRSAGLLRLPLTITGDEELVEELTGDDATSLNGGLFWRMFPMATLARIIRFGILLGAGVGYFVQGDDDPCPVLHCVEHQFLVTRRGSDGHARIYYRTLQGEVEVTPGDGRWFVFAPRGIERFWLYGAWRPVGKFWIAKNVAVEQRMTWGQKMARGIQWISAPNSSTTGERDDIVQFLASAIAPPVIAMLEGWRLESIDVQGTGTEVWKEGKADANAEIKYALTGQEATSGGTSLGLGNGEIFANISQSFIDENAETLAEAIHYQGLVPFAERRGSVAPWATWNTTPPPNQKLIAEAADAAGKGLKSLSEGLIAIEPDATKRPVIDVAAYLEKLGIATVGIVAECDDAAIVEVSGIKVRVEYPEGSLRKGTNAQGESWATLMVGAGYGEIVGTEGEDGDAIDAYVGPFPRASYAFVLEQLRDNGTRDEFKVFLGFATLEHAQETYRRLGRADLEGAWAEVPAALLAGMLRGESNAQLLPQVNTEDGATEPEAVPTDEPVLVEPEQEPEEVAAEDDAVDPPTNDEAVALAEDMTRYAIDRCEHGRVNACDRCGVERVRGVLLGPDGKPAGWKIAWRAIQPKTASEPVAAERPKKYAHIDFTPPKGAREEAQRGLDWRKEHGRGGTAVGVARARDIANGKELSPETVRRMKAFFDRHKNGAGKGSKPGEDGFPSPWRIAIALWGGDAGYAWARKVVKQLEAADKEK